MKAVALLVLVLGCSRAAPLPDAATPPSTLSVRNLSGGNTTVYVAFGADSVVLPGNWSFCAGSGLNCTFALPSLSKKDLPLTGQYVNATFSFGSPVTCGITKAEVNLNNPGWYDIADVSLVDGFSNKVSITLWQLGGPRRLPTVLGPPKGQDGNEKVLGLFPYGCDICVARQNPPCQIPRGRQGCKKGTQYAPDVICQYQGPKMTGGQRVEIRLHP
jgi:hypothetical protein